MYMFKTISSNPFYFPGCREVILRDCEFQENLLFQYFELVKDNCDLRDDGDIKKILKVFSWITSVYTCFEDKSLNIHQISQLMLSQFERIKFYSP